MCVIDPTECRCDCHDPIPGTMHHAAPCCIAAGMTVETRTEWRCEICDARFDDEATAWEHWMNCSEQPAIWNRAPAPDGR